VSSPGAETTGEGAMQAFPSPVVSYFLFPDRHVGSIIAHAGVEWGEGRSIDGVGRLVGLKIGLEGCAGSFAGHGLITAVCRVMPCHQFSNISQV